MDRQSDPVARTQMLIRRPVAEVFDAFAGSRLTVVGLLCQHGVL